MVCQNWDAPVLCYLVILTLRDSEPLGFVFENFTNGAALNAKQRRNVLLFHARVVLSGDTDLVAIDIVETLLPVPAGVQRRVFADR